MGDLRRQAIQGALWSAFQNGAAKIINFGVFVALVRLLSPEDFGLVALVAVVVAFVQLAVEQGFEEAIVQREQLEPEHLDSTFWLCGVVGMAMALALVLAAPYVSQTMGEPRLEMYLVVSAPLAFLAGLSKVPLGMMRREFQFKALAVRQIVAAAVGGGVGIALAVWGAGAWSLIGRQVAESVAAFVVLWIGIRWRPRMSFSLKHMMDILRYGSQVLVTNFLGFMSLRADSLIVGYFLGPVALGFYTVGQRTYQLLLELLQGTINQVALSVFSRLQGEPQRLKAAFLVAVRITSVPAFPAFLLLAVLGREVVEVVFGEQWTEVGLVVSVFALGGLLFSISYYNGSVMKAMGRPSWVLALTALNAVTNMIGFFVGVLFGIVGVAAAFVVRGYLVYPVNLILLRRLIGLRAGEYLGHFGPLLCCALLAAGVAQVTVGLLPGVAPSLQIVLAGAMGLVAYLLLLWVVWPSVLHRFLGTMSSALLNRR